MLFELLVAVLFGALSGVLWGGLDHVFYRLTNRFFEESQIVSIIRMVVAGMIAQNLAVYAIAILLHAMPGGGLLQIVSIVISILVYFNTRVRFDRGF